MLRYFQPIFRFKSCPCSIFSPYQLQRKRNHYSSLIKFNKTSQLKTMASVVTLMKHQLRVGISTKTQTLNLKLNNSNKSRINWNLNRNPSAKIAGLLCLSLSISSGPAFAEIPKDNKNKNENIELNTENNPPSVLNTSHGKEVHKDYSIIGIKGDGSCMFRSLVHGACIKCGRPTPNESLQKQLADELRQQVADEFIKRREECEWFIEGDFDIYVSNIRKAHVWGGEPELFMASHVLQMPIIVYMHDEEGGGLISIAEYGQEYGKENPIRVLYHGFGHYDALNINEVNGPKSRL